MRKTIVRGVLVTATAACALGFGLFQASAATVPALPSVPELPLTSLSNLGNGLAVTPTMPGLPGLPGESSRSALPGSDIAPNLSDLKELLALGETTQGLGLTDLGDTSGLTDIADLPETDGMLPTDLPADQLGLPSVAPGELPVGLDPNMLPAAPQLPTEADDITAAPVVDLPHTDRLPVVAQVDHNGLAQKLIPNTDGVDVQGLPKPQVPDVASSTNAVKLPQATPQTPGMQSLGLPTQLPLVSSVDLPQAPSVHDLTGDVALPTQLPQLPAV